MNMKQKIKLLENEIEEYRSMHADYRIIKSNLENSINELKQEKFFNLEREQLIQELLNMVNVYRELLDLEEVKLICQNKFNEYPKEIVKNSDVKKFDGVVQ